MKKKKNYETIKKDKREKKIGMGGDRDQKARKCL